MSQANSTSEDLKIIKAEYEGFRKKSDEKIALYLETIQDLKKQLDEEKDSSEQLKSKKNQLEDELKKYKSEYTLLLEKKNDVEVKPAEEPNKLLTLSIQLNSILNLNDPSFGWEIRSSDEDRIEALKDVGLIKVGILGMYDVGKSWFCNQLAGREVFCSGYSQCTNSIDFLFPEDHEEGNLIAIIDTPGSHEAIRVTDKKLRQLMKSLEADSDSSKEENYFTIYEKLKNDMKILHDLKERYMREITDVLVLICNKLSEKEQETLFKIIENHKEVNMQRQKEALTGKRRETELIIVHNYKNLTNLDQVSKQIDQDLRKSFDITEELIVSDKKMEGFETCNQTMFRDNFGIDHFIVACNGTEAGKYYNTSTFRFLRSKLRVMNRRLELDFKQSFLDFCNKNLPNLIKQDITLQFNKDRKVIVKDEKSDRIVLKNLAYDALGNYAVLTNSFEPKHSIYEEAQESGNKKIIVNIETMDSDCKAHYQKNDDDGWTYLYIQGTKVKDIKSDEKVIKSNREFGEFKLTIQITRGFVESCQREPKRDQDAKTLDGILRFVFIILKNEPKPC